MEKAITFKNRLWMGIALLHLCLVTLGAASIDLVFPGALGHAVGLYTRITGSGFGYSFFAPGLFDQLVARFEVVDGDGRVRSVPFTSGASNEADIRFRSVIDQFAGPPGMTPDPKRERELRRSLSASLARIFFRRYPEARNVIVHLEEYHYVTMAEYNAGARPGQRPVYQAQFSLNRRVR